VSGSEAAALGLHLDAAGGDAIVDGEAKAAYRARIHELQAELDEAESFHDPIRAETARAEMDALESELAAAFGLGGKARGSRGPFPPDTTLGRHLRYPTLIEVAVVWIIGLFTLVGYVPAVYMTYRYVRLYLERDALAKPGTLRGRLTELDAAHAAGLITEDEHQLKRRALIDTF
jgi:hypothetical protein